MQYSSNWQQAGEFSLLGFSPGLFEQIAHESVRVKRVELIPQIGIHDPLVQQIGLALKADVEAKHPAGRLFGESLATGLVIHLLRQYSVWQPQSFSDNKDRLSQYQFAQYERSRCLEQKQGSQDKDSGVVGTNDKSSSDHILALSRNPFSSLLV